MDRRSFFTRAAGQKQKKQFFAAPTTVPRPTSTLAKYDGPWREEQVAHFSRRVLFGPTKEEMTAFQVLGFQGAVNLALSPLPITAPPIAYQQVGNDILLLPWIHNVKGNFHERKKWLQTWWMQLMMNQPLNIQEKMTLFWSNTLVTTIDAVEDPRMTYQYIKLLRENCLGNFKDLIKEITKNPAMLVFLNGDQNKKGSPNENYARELMELFTLGVSKPDGTPNYTEDDIVEAARILTGYTTHKENNGATFLSPFVRYDRARHDNGSKTFSAHFNNQTIHRVLPTEYEDEIDDLIEMIFARTEVSEFICREIYRWFVYYEIDDFCEANIIKPLAQIFRDNNYEIKPVMQALLESEHFFDAYIKGVQIKNPIDYVVGMAKQLHLFTDQLLPDQTLSLNYQLVKEATSLNMELLNPPGVAGWTAYYQNPNFYHIWVNAATIIRRTEFMCNLIEKGLHGALDYNHHAPFEPISFVLYLTDGQVHSVNILLDKTIALFFPNGITPLQREELRQQLLPGLTDDEWVLEYGTLLVTSVNSGSYEHQSRLKRLKNYFKMVVTMAEQHLT